MADPSLRRMQGRGCRHAGGALVLVLVLLALASARMAVAQAPTRVLMTDVSGAIGVATVRHVSRVIEQARDEKAQVLILRLDTPGGLVTSTRELVQRIIAAPVPVVVYVAPSGARAASAGTFLAYAAHIAAMAPGTNIGAATPVQIGGAPGLPQPRPEPSKDDRDASATRSQPIDQKLLNDTVALLRSLAQMRGRNAEWAEKATREAATLTASEAQKEGVVEIVAADVADLQRQLDGLKVVVDGKETVLTTREAQVVVVAPDARTRLLAAISDPNVAFILLMIGVYGLLLEFWHPGVVAPGVIGGISLILALTALSALPVNYGAMALLLLGLALMIGEIFAPGTLVLGIGGLLAFVAGAYFLFEGAGTDIDIAISPPLIFGMAALTAGLFFGVLAVAVQARRRVPVTGAEQLLGTEARVLDWDGDSGHIHLYGEVWSARSKAPIHPLGRVRVVGREGLILLVED